MAQRLWHKDSTNRLAYRLKSFRGTPINDAVVTATVSRGGTPVFTARTMTFDAAEFLDINDTETSGAYVCEATAAECANEGQYDAVVTATKSGKTKTTRLTVTCIIDTGEA